MSDKKKDVFLQSLTDVKPIKKSNKNFKTIKISNKTKLLKNKKNTIEKEVVLKKDESKHLANYIIQKTPISKKLKKGKISIDKKVDFHGLSVESAKTKFIETVEECFVSNKRCILFITGKGNKKSPDDSFGKKLYYGKIRNSFLSWTNEQNVRHKILNVTSANFFYGGDGAFFVYLRKNKFRFS